MTRIHDSHRRWQKFYQGLGGGGVSYLLYDMFTTARAAGSVNGTLAEPTGQVRTVVDTNSKLSITGGVANVAIGGVGAGNPGLWYPSMTRQAGLILLGVVNIALDGLSIGWDISAVGAISFALRVFSSVDLAIVDNASIISVGAAPAPATNYFCAVVLRATGCWYFIKGGIYTNWTLVYISSLSSSNLLPSFTNIGANGTYTADNIRVPVALYIPLPLAYDTFTRANGALGSTETVSPDGLAIAALVWNFSVGVWAIVSNAAVATPHIGADVIVNGGFAADANWNKGAGWTIAAGVASAAAASSDISAIVAPLTIGTWYRYGFSISGFSAGTVQAVVGGYSSPTRNANSGYQETARASSTAFLMRGAGYTGNLDNIACQPIALADLFATVLCSTADIIIDLAIPTQPDGRQIGIVVNLDSTISPANFIIVYLDGKGNVQIDECVAGAYTPKQTTAITFSASAVLRVERSGTELRAFYNNAAVGVAQVMTVNVNKNHGLFSTSSFHSIDNPTIWARGTSGEYEAALNPL